MSKKVSKERLRVVDRDDVEAAERGYPRALHLPDRTRNRGQERVVQSKRN